MWPQAADDGPRPLRLVVSVAEPSGDRLAAELLAALGQVGELDVRGVTGPALRAAGVASLGRMESLSVMGLTEVLGHLRVVRRIRRDVIATLDPRSTDALIVVDAPDLHLPLARAARDRGIPAIGYVSPQVWAWRPGRVDGIAEALDALLCLFAFEPELYADAAARHGCDVRWVGHPVRDRIPGRTRVDPHHVGLLPGSRPQELDRHLGPFLETWARYRALAPEARATLVVPAHLQDHLGSLPASVTVSDDIASVADCRRVLTKSGTVTLELAVMGVPMVVAHQVSPLTYAVGRRLVRGVSHIALPNILAGREVVPERVQDLDPDALAALLAALPDPQPLDLSALGPPGAADRAAAALLAALPA